MRVCTHILHPCLDRDHVVSAIEVRRGIDRRDMIFRPLTINDLSVVFSVPYKIPS